MMVKLYYCQMVMGGFCSPDKKWIQEQVVFRNEDTEPGDILGRASLIEEDVPNEDIGLCWNRFPHNYKAMIVSKNDSACSVGSIRKMRMNNDDLAGGCEGCPYFVSLKKLNDITTQQMNDNCNCESCVERREEKKNTKGGSK